MSLFLVSIGKRKSPGQLGSRDKKGVDYFPVEGEFQLITKAAETGGQAMPQTNLP